MTKLMLALAIGASAVAFAPQPAAAAGCTDDYYQCLNDTWHYTGISQKMADIECFAEYTGCVKNKFMSH